jgi:hypothetical protein
MNYETKIHPQTLKHSKRQTEQTSESKVKYIIEVVLGSTHHTHVCFQPFQRLSRFRSEIVRISSHKKLIKTAAFVIALRNRGVTQ